VPSSESGSYPPGHFDVEVYAIQEWTGDALLIAADDAHGAGALVGAAAEVAAGVGVHSPDEHEVGWEAQQPAAREMTSARSCAGYV